MADAAKALEHDRSWLSRIENAEVKVHPNTVRLILGLYGVEVEAIEAVANVARETKERGWQQDYADATPEWFSTYIGLERDASVIRTLEVQVFPGWMQTEDYARALLYEAPMPPTAEEIERRVKLRMARRELLTKEDPPMIRLVLEEAVLHKQVGGKRCLAEQIQRCLEIAELPNVDVQVLPFEVGAHAGCDGRFILMDFPPLPPPYPDTTRASVVYLDTLTFARYLEKPNELAAYSAAFERICSAALHPRRSAELIRRIASGLTD